MSDALNLTIVYEDSGDGWIIASVPEVPGAHSQDARGKRRARTPSTLYAGSSNFASASTR
jgi:hypothetical protein